jgi:hypothetical protein
MFPLAQRLPSHESLERWTEKWSSPLKGSAGPLDVDILGKEHRHDEGVLDAK